MLDPVAYDILYVNYEGPNDIIITSAKCGINFMEASPSVCLADCDKNYSETTVGVS